MQSTSLKLDPRVLPNPIVVDEIPFLLTPKRYVPPHPYLLVSHLSKLLPYSINILLLFLIIMGIGHDG